MELRKPTVAGIFYEKGFDELEGQIKKCFTHPRGPGTLPLSKRKRKLSAVIVPHGGYPFSGPCMAWAFKEIAESLFADTYLIIGTNHSAYPKTSTLLDDWQTPFGVIKVDEEFAKGLVTKKIAVHDPIPHLHERSVEVQLPFLQFVSKDNLPKLRFVPLMLAPDISVKELALDLAEMIMDSEKRICIIVSGDFTHYGPNYNYLPFTENVPQKLHDLDMGAVKFIKELDGEGFFNYVRDTGATICGHLPITLLIDIFGKGSVELLQYYSSADISGSWHNAVGYAALSFRP